MQHPLSWAFVKVSGLFSPDRRAPFSRCASRERYRSSGFLDGEAAEGAVLPEWSSTPKRTTDGLSGDRSIGKKHILSC